MKLSVACYKHFRTSYSYKSLFLLQPNFSLSDLSVNILSRKRRLTLSCSVLIVFNESCQTKVSHLAHEAVSYQDVCSTQVPVDIVHPLHVGHACCNLEGERTRNLNFHVVHLLVLNSWWLDDALKHTDLL